VTTIGVMKMPGGDSSAKLGRNMLRLYWHSFRVADKPGAISRGGSRPGAKWIASTESPLGKRT